MKNDEPLSVGAKFLHQVSMTPDALAVSDTRRQLTYRQLYNEAACVAKDLIENDARPGDLVGVETSRESESIVAILAVILAGCAYVPLNPDLPGVRVEKIVNRTRLEHVIIQSGRLDPLIMGSIKRINVREARDVADIEVQPRVHETSPSDPAYVMFTSGSTGEPKGVVIGHGAILNLVVENAFFGFEPQDRLLLSGALEFDASTFEIWGCLLNGASIHMVETQSLVVPHHLSTALVEMAISTLWLTAPLFASIAEEFPETFAPLSTLLVGGDVVSPRHVRKVQELCPGLEIINGYGPTENTTFTTTHRIRLPEPGDIPIGTPISGAEILVVDGDLQLVAPGDRGELLVGGLGLALGYLWDAKRTADAFVRLNGCRYYRTGDVVSQDAAGLLHFHGRIDDQVKVRGHRVELQEIEQEIAKLDVVASVRVLAPRKDDQRMLVAYMVAEIEISTAELRSRLLRVLPEYMVPEQFFFLTALPLTPNGKIDKSKLPQIEDDAPSEFTNLSERERVLASCWSSCLPGRHSALTTNSDFFELGGNSISVGALISQLHRRGFGLTFNDIFSTRNLKAMAARLNSRDYSLGAPQRMPSSVRESPMHPQQKGMHLTWQVDEMSTAYNVSVVFEISGVVSEEDLIRSLSELVRRHDALSMRFDADLFDRAHYPREGETFDWTRSELELSSGESQPASFIAPFDLNRGPLLRAFLVGSAEQIDKLYLDVHHIVLDGVSLKVLLTELADLLAGTSLPATDWTYQEAAAWHDSLTTSESYVTAEAYWIDNLVNPPLLRVPTDFERPALRSSAGAITSSVLPLSEMEIVETLAAEMGSTGYVVLLTAFAATLARISGETDLIIGSPLSGRTATEFDTTVGMFVNTAPIRFSFEPSASLGDLLADSHDQHLKSLEHQIFPFTDILRRLNLPREPSRLPLVEAFFAFQNIDFHQANSGGITLEASLLHSGSSRFDLNLQVYKKPDSILLELEYNTTLFKLSSAERILESFVETMKELCGNREISVFGSVDDDDLSQFIIAEFNF